MIIKINKEIEEVVRISIVTKRKVNGTIISLVVVEVISLVVVEVISLVVVVAENLGKAKEIMATKKEIII